MEFSTPSARWAALTTRNRLADAHFVYAVKTTKIYCRPSCAARLARRANVEFYSTPAAATKAGFRACKRCKPDLEPQDDPQDVAVAKACTIIRAVLSSTDHANGNIGLNELAERVDLTPSYLHKTFKAKMGMTPKAYAEQLRNQIEAPVVAAERQGMPMLSPAPYDAYSTFANEMTGLDLDFDELDGSGLDAVSNTVKWTSTDLSEASTSLNTPTTTDWAWLDTGNTEIEGCEAFNENALAQAMLAQDQNGWNDQLHFSLRKGSEVMSGADERQDVFDMKGDFGRMLY